LIFFVILEAVFVAFSVFPYYSDWWLSLLPSYYYGYQRYCATTFTKINDGYIEKKFFSTFPPNAPATAFYAFSAYHVPTILSFMILLGASSEPVSNLSVLPPITVCGVS